MIRSRFQRSLTSALGSVIMLSWVFGLASHAHAIPTLLGTNVTANLSSPGDGINATDTAVPIGAGIEIQPGTPGSNIAPFLFTSVGPLGNVPEYIDFFATGVILRIAGANPDNSGTTGYATGAKYVFSLFGPLPAGSTVQGITSIGLSSNISNFSSTPQAAGCSAGACFDSVADTLTVYLDQMIMGPDGNLPAPMGLVTINLDLVTPTPVPEPGTLTMMMLVGLVVAGAMAWRRGGAVRRGRAG
jgi:PEP-CTERM motif-containing protein